MSIQERTMIHTGFIQPAVTVEEAAKAFKEYQKLKKAISGPGDFKYFNTRDGVKEAPTKQWRGKVTRFFGLSLELIEETEVTLPDGSFIIKTRYRATAPNGSSMEGDGACWSKTKENYDRDGKPIGDLYHNTRSHAHTRGKNRAVFELVGFGEVSAEEIEVEEEKPEGVTTPRMAGDHDDPITPKQHDLIWRKASQFEKNHESRAAFIAMTYDVDVRQKDGKWVIGCTKKRAGEIIEDLIARERKAGEPQTKEPQTLVQEAD